MSSNRDIEELTKIDCSKKFSLNGMIFDAKVIGVYDGDTVTAIFKYRGEYSAWSCRLIGIDTPEFRTKNEQEKRAAIEARDFLRGCVLNKIIKIECGEFDKYGRLLVKLIDEFGKDINQLMVTTGYARMYDCNAMEAHKA
jgi:micrococcal nuclease